MHTRSTIEIPRVDELARIGAENNPNGVAFSDAHRDLTWEKFDAESTRAANAFRHHLTQGDRVAFICQSSVDHIVMMQGASKAGAIPSNLHVRASPDTFRYCIDTLRPRVVVIDEKFSERFANRIYPELETDISAVVTTGEPMQPYEQPYSEFLSEGSEKPVDIRIREEDTAAVWWTSGTTGKPKGWCHTHRGIMLKATKSATTKMRNARRLMVLDPGFAAWWGTTMATMLATGTIVYRQEWNPESVLSLIEEERLTHAGFVTTMWREILRRDDLDSYDLSSLQRIFSTGEKLDPTTLSELEERICDTIKNGYSSTEIVGTEITNHEMEGDRIESVGKPIIGQQLRIIEEGGDPDDVVPANEIGEIIIKGPDAPVWAWDETERTEKAFTDGWWYSGDLGYKDEDGYLYLEGRADFMITSKGMKVFPSPIEERLNSHPGVEESIVVGIDDEEYGERVTAIVKRTGEDADVGADELDQYCLDSDEIARFERPRAYHFVDHLLPRTASGKLDRQSAIRQFEE
ncbi:class I adenylate-forming enzyme family protein [Halobellus salinisoli]|uniref:class I adenylate-forming enzyme family protein n=1 Tax=Halobellus salinisoli TaxID=3108500 RepID=UPI00300A3656